MYVVGLITTEEQTALEKRGWQFEPPPKALVPKDIPKHDQRRMRMVWVDSDLYKVMTGPDWEGAPRAPATAPRPPATLGDPDIWLQPDEATRAADCGCVLTRSHDGSDDPAVWLCDLHRKGT